MVLTKVIRLSMSLSPAPVHPIMMNKYIMEFTYHQMPAQVNLKTMFLRTKLKQYVSSSKIKEQDLEPFTVNLKQLSFLFLVGRLLQLKVLHVLMNVLFIKNLKPRNYLDLGKQLRIMT